jgi:hypothetical protein
LIVGERVDDVLIGLPDDSAYRRVLALGLAFRSFFYIVAQRLFPLGRVEIPGIGKTRNFAQCRPISPILPMFTIEYIQA